MYMYDYTYIRELAHARPPMSSISLVIYTDSAAAVGPPVGLAQARPKNYIHCTNIRK